MSNGLGAGFALLTILAVLLGVAVLLGLLTAGAVALERRSGTRPAPIRYVAAGLLAVALVVAGFGAVALADEALVGAALLVALVFVPLAGAGAIVRRAGHPDRLALTATTAMAWGGAYIFGIAVLAGLVVGLEPALGLAPGEARQVGLPWLETAVAGLAALAVALALASGLPRLVPTVPGAPGDR